MKAIVRARCGPPDVLQFTEVEKSVLKDTEVLIKLYAALLNPLDVFRMRGTPLMRRFSSPKQQVLGCDTAGRVEALGGNAKQFQAGDGVFGVTGFAGGGQQFSSGADFRGINNFTVAFAFRRFFMKLDFTKERGE